MMRLRRTHTGSRHCNSEKLQLHRVPQTHRGTVMCDKKTTPKATLGIVPLTLHFEMTFLEGREDWGCQVGKLAWQLNGNRYP